MSACPKLPQPTLFPFTRVLVAYSHVGSEFYFPECGCVVRECPMFREAVVCRQHSHWKIEADLIRYL